MWNYNKAGQKKILRSKGAKSNNKSFFFSFFQIHQKQEVCQQVDGANILLKHKKTTIEEQVSSRKAWKCYICKCSLWRGSRKFFCWSYLLGTILRNCWYWNGLIVKGMRINQHSSRAKGPRCTCATRAKALKKLEEEFSSCILALRSTFFFLETHDIL